MAPSSMLEEVLHRDRVIVGSVALVNRTVVVVGCARRRHGHERAERRACRATVMTPAVWTAGYAALMVSMWFVMMVARC
jgi:hypothetical protein